VRLLLLPPLSFLPSFCPFMNETSFSWMLLAAPWTSSQCVSTRHQNISLFFLSFLPFTGCARLPTIWKHPRSLHPCICCHSAVAEEPHPCRCAAGQTFDRPPCIKRVRVRGGSASRVAAGQSSCFGVGPDSAFDTTCIGSANCQTRNDRAAESGLHVVPAAGENRMSALWGPPHMPGKGL